MATKDISQLGPSIIRALESVATTEIIRLYAEQILDIIYKRTKSGKGLSSDKVDLGRASLVKLKALTENYINRRKVTDLGPFGRARFSNLTLSGEMLESMRVIKRGRDWRVEIPDDRRSDGGEATNAEVAQFVTDQGRPFFGLSKTEFKRVENFIRRTIRQKLRSRRL